MSAQHRVTVSLDEQTVEDLRLISRSANVSVSEAIRQILREHFDTRERPMPVVNPAVPFKGGPNPSRSAKDRHRNQQATSLIRDLKDREGD